MISNCLSLLPSLTSSFSSGSCGLFQLRLDLRRLDLVFVGSLDLAWPLLRFSCFWVCYAHQASLVEWHCGSLALVVLQKAPAQKKCNGVQHLQVIELASQ